MINYTDLAAATPAGAIADPEVFYQHAEIFGDSLIICPSYYVATSCANVGVPVYKLTFASGLEYHSATVPYLFSASDGNEQAMWMKDYFSSFIVSQDPNGNSSIQGKPLWPQYTSNPISTSGSGFQVMGFNQSDVGVRADTDVGSRCNWWHLQNHIVRN